MTEGKPYVVKAHDSLARIGHRNHVSVAQLKAANNLNSDLLRIGQKLIIPARTQVAATTPTATSPDASVSTTAPTAVTPTTPKSAVSTTPTPKTTVATAHEKVTSAAWDLHHHLYTVVKGDTLTKIAHKFKTTASALIAANSITDPAKLSIGKKLKIPSKESRSAKVTEPAVAQPAQVQAKAAGGTPQLANIAQ